MKTNLTIEESQNLVSNGVDEKFASEYIHRHIVIDENFPNKPTHKHTVSNKCYAVFTLADIINLLPKVIDDDKILLMKHDNETESWCVGYNMVHLETSTELIDALYKLLLWYLNK